MTSNTAKRMAGLSWTVLLLPPLFVPHQALADSGVGVDTWLANILDPTGGLLSQPCDPDGTSWLAPLQHRSPTGNLYDCPPEAPLLRDLSAEWRAYGILSFGYVHVGDGRTALYNRYSDWRGDNPVLGLLDLHVENPYTGEYVELRGSHISDDDQYYQAVYGEAGAFKVQAFLRDLPNILSTDARPIWNGVGSNALTLPASLLAGRSTPGEVAAVSAATPVQTLRVDRKKEGLGVSGWLTPEWTAYLDLTHEARQGARPYGGAFGYDWPPNSGAMVESVKPIDDYTINLNTGFRYAGETWRADLGYSGSFYRDRYLSYSFEQPFVIPTVVPVPAGTITAPLTQGQMAMEPDNDYHNLHATVTRVTPLDGELSLSLSEVLMEQRASLIAPTNCQGFLGFGVPANGSSFTAQDVGPRNPSLFDCSQWNTTAALSQTRADVNMHNTLAALSLVLRPSRELSADGGFKFYRQEYDNDYLAFNPENGYYGYVAENGTFNNSVGVPVAIVNGAFPPGGATDARVAPYQLSMDDYNVHAGVSWHVTPVDTLGAQYVFDQYQPESRERSYVDDSSLKLTWVNKSLSWLTFRANYTYLRQTGSIYVTDVYGYTFLSGLPAFQAAYPSFVPLPEQVDALRKYDLADRTENKLDLMATIAAREDLTVTASVRGERNQYPVVIGRQGYNTLAAQISTEWTPTTTDNFSAYIGYDQSNLGMSSVASTSNGPVCPNLGCPFYPIANYWAQTDHERNYSAGLTLQHRLGPALLDLSYSYIYSRSLLDYSAASGGALVYPDEFTALGSEFPPMTYRVSSVTLGVTTQLSDRVSLRIFDNYQVGDIADYHYDGFNQGLVVNNSVFTDAGPQSYKVNLIGLLISVKL